MVATLLPKLPRTRGSPWAEYQPAYACACSFLSLLHMGWSSLQGRQTFGWWLMHVLENMATQPTGYHLFRMFSGKVGKYSEKVSKITGDILLSLGTTVCLRSVLASALQPCRGLTASFSDKWEQGACQGGRWSWGVEDPREEQSEGKFGGARAAVIRFRKGPLGSQFSPWCKKPSDSLEVEWLIWGGNGLPMEVTPERVVWHCQEEHGRRSFTGKTSDRRTSEVPSDTEVLDSMARYYRNLPYIFWPFIV